jgi:hypothetical protein
MSELTAIHGKACRTKLGDDIFGNFPQFVAIIWRAKEFSCNYFSGCFIIACNYSLIQFIFCTEATEGSTLNDGESDAQKFLSSTYCSILLCTATRPSDAAYVSQYKVLVAKLVM